MPVVVTTRVQRRITRAAIKPHKVLAQNAAAIAKRLHIDERAPLEALGANDALDTAIRRIPDVDDNERTVDVPMTVVRTWRALLGIWTKAVQLKSDQLSLLEVNPQRAEKIAEANALLRVLDEALGAPSLGLEEMTAADNAKPKKEKKKDAPIRPTRETAGKDRAADAAVDDDATWDEGPPPVDKEAVQPLALHR